MGLLQKRPQEPEHVSSLVCCNSKQPTTDIGRPGEAAWEIICSKALKRVSGDGIMPQPEHWLGYHSDVDSEQEPGGKKIVLWRCTHKLRHIIVGIW
jgi:hypothetical protein